LKRALLASAAGVLALIVVPALRGQAWIAPRGETTISLTLERTEHEGHLLNNGKRFRVGGSHASALALDVEYSLTDRLAFSAGIPYVSTENGPDPNPVCFCREGLDDGKYHSTWQDFRFGARYNVLVHPVVLTPLISVRIPSHHYATIAEAAPGRHLREFQAGIAAGRVFEPADLTVYVAGQYTYTVVEKVLGVSTNRSNADLDIGTFPRPTVTVHAFVNWQNTHGGVTSDFVLNFDNKVLHPVLYRVHDGLLRDNYWRGGIGAGYSITERTNLGVSLATAIAGTNSHYGYFYNVGVSRTFGSSHNRVR
jgi:hypothetical protein